MVKFKSLLHVITLLSIVCLLLNLRGAQAAGTLGTAFTYQGQLKDGGGNPITNTCDFQFGLYPALSGGSLVPGTTLQTVTGVAVTSGYFTVSLDFGAGAFDGNARWLQIAVSCPAGGSYTPLTPRQPLTAAPYALYAVNAGTAATLSGVLPLASGGTGSATKNFVDLTTAQTVGGVKTFSSAPSFTAGIPFNVTGSNLVTNLNADLLDGKHASAFQQHVQNVRVVAKSGGDYTTVTAALASITDASAANPYLIYVAPGVYTETITMKPWVDIEGAGELATRITYTGSSDDNTATVVGADNSELRFLTVENTGGDMYATAIYNSSASPRLTHITATTSGGTYSCGVYNYSSSPAMSNITVTASGATSHNYGVCNNSSSPTMSNVTAVVFGGYSSPNYAVYNYSTSSPKMMNVTATASGGGASTNYGVFNSSSSPTMTNITATGSDGGTNGGVYNGSSSPIMTDVRAIGSGGTYTIGVWNDHSSLTMTNVTATGSGGTSENDGVFNVSSSITMTNVTATASGGTDNYGVYNEASAATTMSNVTATVSGGTNTYGVYNTAASPTMMNVTVIASGGTFNRGVANYSASPTMTGLTATVSGGNSSYGVWNDSSSVVIRNSVIVASNGSNASDGIHNTALGGDYTVTIDASQISATNSTIYSDSVYYTTRIGASEISGGGVQGAGNYKCVGSYNENYDALDATCH